MDSDPGEGTSDGRVTQKLKDKLKIKREIEIKEEFEDDRVYEYSSQPMTSQTNETIKSESENDEECDLINENDLMLNKVKCEKKCKNEKLDLTKDGKPDGHQNTSKKNPDNNEKRNKRHVKKGKERRLQQDNNRKASNNRSEKGQRKMHKCHLCNYETSKKGDLTRHIRIHTGERPFECEVCWKSFTRKNHLKRHQKIHGDQFRFHCSKCKCGFAKEIDKLEHEKKCNRRQIECHLCKYSTQEISNLKRHLRLHHTGEKPFRCEFCSKAFVTKDNLGIHLRTHTKELPYDCSKCGQRFVNENLKQLHEKRCKVRRYECYACRHKHHIRNDLKIHMKHKHTGDKQFQCAICEMKFVQKIELNRHLATHSKKRPIRCSKCLWKFAQTDEKEQHEEHCTRRHYQCFMCGSTSSRLDNLKNHIRALHTGDKPFQCKMCDTRLPSKSQLSNHMKRKHISKN